jgi:hypothetical protein
MERKIIYDINKSQNGYKFNDKTLKFEYSQKNASVRIIETCNDLRYCGYGLQSVLSISICFPDHWIDATKRYTKEGDLEKAEIFINKHLKKNGYSEVSFLKDFEKDVIYNNQTNQGWVMENEYQIKNITK